MRIIGIDPGFERLGVAVLEKNPSYKKEKVVFSECFKTSAELSFSLRLVLLGKEIARVLKKYKPEILAVETLFLNTNQKTAMQVASVRGVILYEAERAGLKIFEASPPEIKSAVAGHGRADKAGVMKMVKMLVDFGKGQEKQAESDDELDAIAVALTASARQKNVGI